MDGGPEDRHMNQYHKRPRISSPTPSENSEQIGPSFIGEDGEKTLVAGSGAVCNRCDLSEMDNFWNLTNDSSFDVLSRLPIRNLLALRCVSKSCKHLISDASFIGVLSKKTEPLSGFFVQQRYWVTQEDIKIISYVPVVSKEGQVHQNVFKFLPENVVVLTSCNGLVCCRSCLPFDDPAIYVCNPLNKEWHILDYDKPEKEDSIAIAFDPVKDLNENSTNFRAVRVEQYENEQGKYCYRFHIYSSNTRKWKLSEGIYLCSGSLYKNKGVYIRGILHWLTDGDQILTFDVERELVWLLPLPVPSKAFRAVTEACIGEFEDQLHYIVISEEGLLVWFLEDLFGCTWSLRQTKTLADMEVENSFINLYEKLMMRRNIGDYAWIDPLAFKDGILFMRVASVIYFYHVETGRMELVCDCSAFGTDSSRPPTVIPYSMSLIRLN